MPLDVLAAVLFSAMLHAGWNALVRAASDKFLDTVLIVLGAGMLMTCLIPFLPLPAPASWPYLGASVLVHVVYFSLVAFAYRNADMSFAYPVMRGSASAFSAIAALLLLGEAPSPGGWVGVLLISTGVLLLAGESMRAGRVRPAVAGFALSNAAVIVVYTLIDGQGARLSGHALSYTGWMFLLTGILLMGVSAALQGGRILVQIRRGWRKGLLGGGFTLASYALALWAMTQSTIAAVAALRETSVVFGAIIAAVFLKESISRLRYASILVVSAGAVVLKTF